MFESNNEFKKRLYMRSIRRGIKEMDVILQQFSEAALAKMNEEECAQYESFLNENDHDLYAWVSNRQPIPEKYAQLVAQIQVVLRKSP